MKTSLPPCPLSAPRAPRRCRPKTPEPRQPYPVLIAYADIASARNAVDRVAKLLRAKQPDCELLPMLWRFDQLDQPRWREMALREAGRAAGLVLAMNASAVLSPGTDAWLTALTAQQRGTVINALTLLGDEAWTISLQQTAATASAPEKPLRPPEPMTAAVETAMDAVAICAA